MSEPTKTYKKHNSFLGLRQKKPLADCQARVEKVLKDPSDYGLGVERGALVKSAARELLGLQAPPAPHPAFLMHDNVQEEISHLADSELPRYLHYRFRYEAYPDRKILDDAPPCLQIEPTSVCNFRCVFCYQTDDEFTAKKNGHMGMMTLDTFKRIVDMAEGRVEAVSLASRGEPLVCPQIGEMLAYAKGKFLALKMNTNASLLDEAKCHAILSAELQTVVFSADAAVEPDYSRLRVGGNLEKTLKNVRLFQEIRLKHYPKTRTITRVSGVKVDQAANLEDMERVWGDYVDQVAFVAYNPWEDAYHAAPNGIQTPCSDLWRRLFVWWDGAANPCDVDFKSKLAMGSLLQSKSLKDVWRSEHYESLRRDHLEKKRSAHSPCAGCAVV
ncbi:MAG: radical SAM/SPASM domain-containing protein [Elusimicrobiota bacterium]